MTQTCHDCGALFPLPKGMRPLLRPKKNKDGTVTKAICAECRRTKYAGISERTLAGWVASPDAKTGALTMAMLYDLHEEVTRKPPRPRPKPKPRPRPY